MAHLEHIYVSDGSQLHTITRIVQLVTSPFGAGVDTVSSRSREPIGECPREAMGEGLPRHFLPPRSDGGGSNRGAEGDNRSPSLIRVWITPKGRYYLQALASGIPNPERAADSWDDLNLS